VAAERIVNELRYVNDMTKARSLSCMMQNKNAIHSTHIYSLTFSFALDNTYPKTAWFHHNCQCYCQKYY